MYKDWSLGKVDIIIDTDECLLARFWRLAKPFISYLVGRRSDILGKIYSTIKRPIKAQDSFKFKQITAILIQVWTLRLGNYSSTGPLYLFLLLATKKGHTDIQSDRHINWLLGFLSKIMSNIVGRPIRGLYGRPDKSF